jgi:two-component system, chemotaxis family, CheB/CheR fusion protein
MTPEVAKTPKRILVVDDDRDGAEAAAVLLRLEGHTVETAYDGVEALGVASRFHPQVVLLDVSMPELDGFDVAVRMRVNSWAKGLKLIAVTGWNRAEDRDLARRSSFDGFLVKPLDFDQLIELLEE